MIISFFSNYLTHHQIPFCDEMCRQPDVEFHFVSTIPMEQERKDGGWEFSQKYPYEVKAYEDDVQAKRAMELAVCSDVMIIGSAPEDYVKVRMRSGKNKLTIRYSERIYKGGRWRVLSPRGALRRLDTYFRYLGKPLYMLCASAYTAGDLAMLGSYLGRCYKWGYFPETKTYKDIGAVLNKKEATTILWTARLIDWKHPEVSVQIASRLKKSGYNFRLDMIGVGPMEQKIRQMIEKENLQEQVHLLGTMSPEAVREQMENHQIFIFTSDQNEGWGAVLNEAMNSGCAVVANRQIGSVPFLLKNGENGFIYDKGNVDALYEHVKYLLDHFEKAAQMGKNAYETIISMWSAEPAAQRLLTLCENLLAGKKKAPYAQGPCSKAYINSKKRSK